MSITLARNEAGPQDHPELDPKGQPRREPPRKVLVIGYCPGLLEGARHCLTGAGYEVIVANSLRGALAGALNHRPDAILSVNLLRYQRVISSLIFRLNTTPNARRVPIVVWTAFGHNPHLVKDWIAGFRLHFDDCLYKVCLPSEILNRVRSAIRRANGL